MTTPQNGGLEPPLDAAVFNRLRQDMGGAESPVFKQILASFLSESAAHLQTLREAVQEGALETAVKEAHLLRGAASNFGARTFQALCLEAEQRARTQDPTLSDSAKALTTEFERVRAALMGGSSHA